jgi:hypothetical protein
MTYKTIHTTHGLTAMAQAEATGICYVTAFSKKA